MNVSRDIKQGSKISWSKGIEIIQSVLLTLLNYVRNQYQKILGNNKHIFKCNVTFTKRDPHLSPRKQKRRNDSGKALTACSLVWENAVHLYCPWEPVHKDSLGYIRKQSHYSNHRGICKLFFINQRAFWIILLAFQIPGKSSKMHGEEQWTGLGFQFLSSFSETFVYIDCSDSLGKFHFLFSIT